MRGLTGVRNFNRRHTIEANLHETMRSIASSWHKARARRPEISLDDLIKTEDQDPLEVITDSERVQASPEEELAYKQAMDELLAHFADREDAQMVLLGRAEGLQGKELAAFAGMDQPRLASVLRHISRHLANYRREA